MPQSINPNNNPYMQNNNPNFQPQQNIPKTNTINNNYINTNKEHNNFNSPPSGIGNQQPYCGPSQYNMPPQYNPSYQPYLGPDWRKGCSIASMVIGMISILLECFIYFVPAPLATIGLVLGIVSLAKQTKHRGIAIAGVILSGIALFFGVLLFFCFVVYFFRGEIPPFFH